MDKDKIIENFLVPLLIAFTVFLFFPSHNYYIFGQDSMQFFGQFTFYSNPLYSFNNGLEMIYFSLLNEFVIHLFSSVILSQRILIFVAVYISAIGFFDLVDVIAKLESSVARVISKSLGSVLFLFNPFTLSVTWPHILAWSMLILLSPFIMSFLTDTVYNGGNIKRFTVTSLLMMVLIGGIVGGYYPFFLLVVAVFLIFPIYNMIRHVGDKNTLISMLRRIIYLIAFVGVSTLWAVIPLYQGTFSSLSSTFNGSFLLRFFLSESRTTTLPNVLSLTGYSWLYGVPSAYPWISYFSKLQASAYILLFFIPAIPIVLKKFPKIFPLVMISVLAVIFSTGSNFPFGVINEHLLFLKGPFLFLVNPYYFVLQFYVLFLSLLLSLVFYVSVSKEKRAVNSAGNRNMHNLMPKVKRNYQKILAVMLILFMAGTFFYPFATAQVYQTNGPNIDAINIDNGLLELRNYLRENYSTPDYYTLLIPTSSLDGATYLTYNNDSTFADSRGLISNIDPYPLIWQNNSYLADSIENYLSSNNLQNMRNVFDYLHIKYIIFTENYSLNNYMLRSVNGHFYNFESIYNSLENSFGPPTKFGDYAVFTNRYSTPDLELIENPVFINTTLSNYLDFLGSINSTLPESETSVIYNSIISDRPLENNDITLIKAPSYDNYKLPVNNTLFLMDNGTIENYTGLDLKSAHGFMNISPVTVASLQNSSTYITDMNTKNNTLYSNYGSYIYVDKTISAPLMFRALFKISNLPHSDRIYFNIGSSNITISTEFINVTNGKGNMDLQLTSSFTGQNYYAWNNIPIPVDSIGKNISFSIQINTNYTMDVNVNVNSIGFTKSAIFYYGANNYMDNPGFDTNNFESIKNITTNYQFQFSSGGNFPITFYKFYLYKAYPYDVKYIFVENVSKKPILFDPVIETSIYGNYYIAPVNSGYKNTYLYFFGYPEGTWNAYTNLSNNELPIFSKDNFSLVFTLPIEKNAYGLKIQYESLVPILFEISIAEILGLLSLLVCSIAYNIYKKKRVQ